jgi:hypothetical protein
LKENLKQDLNKLGDKCIDFQHEYQEKLKMMENGKDRGYI